MNEHLIEALRRLRKSSSDTNVDRRLVTNVLLSFLSTPRADPKRFEMLGLLATVLGWGDAEREKAGLIRSLGVSSAGATANGASGGSGLFWGRGVNGAASPSKSKNMELEKTDETEVRCIRFPTWCSSLDYFTSRSPVCGSSSCSRKPIKASPNLNLDHYKHRHPSPCCIAPCPVVLHIHPIVSRFHQPPTEQLHRRDLKACDG